MENSRWVCRLAAAIIVVSSLLAVPRPVIGAESASPDLHALLPDRVKQSGTLVIATDAHHPPNESYAEDGRTVVGFEPDIWNRLAGLLGVRPRIISVDFGGLIPGVQAGRFDVAFESLSDSPAREHEVTFVDFGYASAALYTLTSNTAITNDTMSLCGLKAGVQAGTDFATSVADLSARCVARRRPPIDVKEFASDAATVMALYSRRVDFALDDRLAARNLIQFAPHPLKIVDMGLPRFTVGAVVRHDDKALATALLAAFERMHVDGSYGAIIAKWQIPSLAFGRPALDLAAGGH